MCRDKTTITKPAAILNSFEFCKRAFPINVEATPKAMKTIEKPAVNKKSGVKFIFFFANNSSIELPEI